MKKIYYLIISSILIINTSCDEWLNVQPSNNVTEETIFENSHGFRTSLNALYYKMANTNLYGKELMYGFVDILSRQYDLKDKMSLYSYRDIFDYKFETLSAKPIIEKVWDDGYNIIANANNLLKNIEDKPSSFFENKEDEKNMIKGEALACRALMHFDLLRLFAPAPINDDGANYIPYVKIFPNVSPQSTTVDKCIDNVISDLEKALELTAKVDTTEIGYANGGVLQGEEDEINIFFLNRGFRLHYNAIKAVLARAYQYAGKHDKALTLAEELINAEYDGDKVYNFNYSGIEHSSAINDYNSLLNSWETKTNLKLLNDLIFAVDNPKLYYSGIGTSYFQKNLTAASKTTHLTLNENQNVFNSSQGDDESTDDIRSKYLIFQSNDWNNPVSGKWFVSYDNTIAMNNTNIIPMIRLSEMCYIAAEAYARSGNYDKAKELLNMVRYGRGVSSSISIGSIDDFEKELIIDARREWISEGQLFYLFKRLDAKVDFTYGIEPRKFTETESVIPIPQNQSI